MTNQEKSDLQWKVRFLLGQGFSKAAIVDTLQKLGFQKQTIKKYIAAFSS